MTSHIRPTALAVLVAFVVAFVPSSLLAQGLTRAEPESVGMSSERLDRLTEALQGYVDDGRLAGAVAIVVRRGRIAYLEAVGQRDVATGSAMAADSIFRIASQTKALVSTGVMLLQEEGRLLVTDPIGNYLPAFKNTTVAEPNDSGGYDVVAPRRPITIRDLLTHTAGISYGNGPAAAKWDEAEITGWYFADRDETVGAVMARLAELPLDAHPGETWIYGYNTDILGAMIEEITGQTLGAFLGERLLGPLGMGNTHFFLPMDKVERLATVYSSTDDGGIERAPDPGHMVGQGAYVHGPAQELLGRCGAAVDRSRLRDVPTDDAERRYVRRHPRPVAEDGRIDDRGSPRRHPVPAGPGLRPRLLHHEEPGGDRTSRVARRVRMGRRLPFDLLGRPRGGDGRRLPDAAHPGARHRRPRQASHPHSPGDHRLRRPAAAAGASPA